MIVVFRTFFNMFRIDDLRRKIFYTLFVVAVFRLGNYVTLPGINAKFLFNLMNSFSNGGMFSIMDIVSGGGLTRGSIFALGISPYITASIMMQLLQMSVPHFELLAKEGASGRNILKQYTRYLTVLMSFLVAATTTAILEMSGVGGGGSLFVDPGMLVRMKCVFLMGIGAIFCMWLGEQISRYGIGQGSSILIFASSVASLPTTVKRMLSGYSRGEFDLVLLLGVAVTVFALVALIIFIERGERRISVQYAKRVVGKQVFGGVSSYIPFKINSSSIMPVIMATNFIGMVTMISRLFSKYIISIPFFDGFMTYGTFSFSVINIVAIVIFAYLWTSMMYNPIDLADNLRKSGAVIAGIRPGQRTAEFLNSVLTRISFPGAWYIAFVAVLPTLATKYFAVPIYAGGTTLLIVVGVAMDTFAQIESFLIEQKYSGFLDSKKRLRGRQF